MIDLTRHPRLLRFLSYVDRAKNFLLGRNRGYVGNQEQSARFYERAWREAAGELGAAIEPLGNRVFEIRLGDVRTRVQDNVTGLDSLATHCIVRTKPVMQKLLARQGLPIARYFHFTLAELPAAADFMDKIGKECVVKPAEGTGGGLGVTTNIRTRWQLARAAQAASFHSADLILEEQIPGDNYRLLFLDGELLDVVVRRRPSVVADGRSSVQKLVQAINDARLRQGEGEAHALLKIDLEMQQTLSKQGLTLGSVPAQGSVVRLKTASNDNSADDNESVTEQVCPAIVRAAAKAVDLGGVRLAGVDVLTQDHTVPLEESGGVILEVNNPPGFFWHYHTRNRSFPVAVHVLRRLLRVETFCTAPVALA